MHDDVSAELIARADLDGLIRLIDELCERREWATLWRLRQSSRAALETGRQLWPAATLADFRLALLAPAEWACRPLLEEPGRFSIGPLSEVIAQHHSWDEVAEHFRGDPAVAAYVAQERVLRGDDLRDDPDATESASLLALPLMLEPWEFDLPVATYSEVGVQAPAPEALTLTSPLTEIRATAAASTKHSGNDDDGEIERAVRGLVQPWLVDGNGRIEFASVDGTHIDAIAALGHGVVRIDAVAVPDVACVLTWAGASGGAHGRRRGGAAGRWNTWWLARILCGFDPDDDIPGDELGETMDVLSWYLWTPEVATAGWDLGLAVTDPSEAWTWAFRVTDHVTER